MLILFIVLSDKYLTSVLLKCGRGSAPGSWPVTNTTLVISKGGSYFLVDYQLMQTILGRVRRNACDMHAYVYVSVRVCDVALRETARRNHQFSARRKTGGDGAVLHKFDGRHRQNVTHKEPWQVCVVHCCVCVSVTVMASVHKQDGQSK